MTALLALLVPAVVQGQGGTTCHRPVGPDVIVGELNGISNYGTVDDITAFAVGTTSCNVGNEELLWIAEAAQHPVIGQNMYRLKAGRFEQIGMSWLKHGFFALSENECGCGCVGTDGTRLGVGCSDPYTSSLNGFQQVLGPRSEVNATTGAFPYPFSTKSQTGNAVYKRLQVHNDDLDPALNPGALYFVEGQYVSPDDAAAGNKDNNASYQPVVISPNGGTYLASLDDSTARERSAIEGWADSDPTVQLRSLVDPDGGLFRLGSRCSQNPDSTYHYEYALYNMNSHRSARAFHVPVISAVTVSNIGFHDVDYHSGEPYDGTDWAVSTGGDLVSWSTSPFAENPDANALRWGTMYNFRFDANAAPQDATVTVDYFRPGAGGDSVTVPACVPGTSPAVCAAAESPLAPPASSHALNAKNRYLTIDPGNPGTTAALRVRLVESSQFPGSVGAWWWVGTPVEACEQGSQATPPCNPVPGVPDSQFYASRLQCSVHCMDWGSLGGPISIGDINVVPDAEYEVQAVACACDVTDEGAFSAPLAVSTSPTGDTLGDCATCPCRAPDGFVNIVDCIGVIRRFANAACAPLKSRVDLHPAVPDRVISTSDVLRCIAGFAGLPYPYPAPRSCGS